MCRRRKIFARVTNQAMMPTTINQMSKGLSKITPNVLKQTYLTRTFITYENSDIAIAMSSSHTEPVLGINIVKHESKALTQVQLST